MREKLYCNLTTELQRRLPAASEASVKNLALLTQALVFSPDCHLSNLAIELPIEGHHDSIIQRLRRFVDNCRVSQRVHYQPLVRGLLASWPDEEVNLVMARTDIGQESSILLLGLAFHHRVIPLAWEVGEHGASNEATQVKLLRQIQPYIPAEKRVHFYGDGEFRAVGLQGYCRQQGWEWQVGLKSDTLFDSGTGQWQPLRSIAIEPGERRYWHDVLLTKDKAFPHVHLMIDWTQQTKTARYTACSQVTNAASWRRGRKRFWIEPTNRDWKSAGFDLEDSYLDSHQRLEHLLLGMAVATLWLLLLGEWLSSHSPESAFLLLTAPGDYSYFRLGRDYARRCQVFDRLPPIRLQR